MSLDVLEIESASRLQPKTQQRMKSIKPQYNSKPEKMAPFFNSSALGGTNWAAPLGSRPGPGEVAAKSVREPGGLLGGREVSDGSILL